MAGCSSDEQPQQGWVDDEVSFVADGLTIYGTYRHQHDAAAGPAALLISESGPTDRNGDNAVVGSHRQYATAGRAAVRQGRHQPALRQGRHRQDRPRPLRTNPTDVGSAVYTAGARSAVRFLAEQPATDTARMSVYALGEGTIHAMSLASDSSPGAPKIHSLGLFQPLPGRYLDIITGRVRADADAAVLSTWLAAVDQVRTTGTVPTQLPDGLGAILNPGNVKAVVEADKIDPLALAAKVPAGTPVLLTCSDSDRQANCDAMRPLIDTLKHTALTVVELKGVNHVLRDDASDNVANFAKQAPLSPQLVTALDGFVGK